MSEENSNFQNWLTIAAVLIIYVAGTMRPHAVILSALGSIIPYRLEIRNVNKVRCSEILCIYPVGGEGL